MPIRPGDFRFVHRHKECPVLLVERTRRRWRIVRDLDFYRAMGPGRLARLKLEFESMMDEDDVDEDDVDEAARSVVRSAMGVAEDA